MPKIQQKTVKTQIILFDSEHFSAPRPEIFTSQHWHLKDAITGQATGRGTTFFFQHNKNEYVLRHYHRGGIVSKILSDQYLYTCLELSRAWQEFKLLQYMQTIGLASPKPSAAMVTKHSIYYQADIILTKIPDAQDLHHILLKKSLPTDIWQKIGQTVAAFHHHQIYHHDLNIHNIMLDAENRVWLIDFDKCGIRRGNHWKKANLMRLERSLIKEKAKNTDYHLLPSNYQSICDGYLKNTYN
jgi:3-deoxy-D-manno-octulosonic acid kinase